MNLTDSFDMGFDIQQYYSLHQNLTLEDLAKASSRHTLKGVVKVINKVSLSPIHSDLKCLITFGNWFWDLIVGNRSKVLNFYQQRPVFALKNYPRPQRPKRPMKANKGQQSPKLQISLLLSLFNVKSSINVNMILKKSVFKKSEIFIFIT